MIGKHTPGPWKAHIPTNVMDHEIYTRHHRIARVYNYAWAGEHADRERDEANARLIAAAPDLLEALEDLLGQTYASTLVAPSVMDRARAAIAKAKGEVP